MNAFEGLDHDRRPTNLLSLMSWFARRIWRSGTPRMYQRRALLLQILTVFFILFPTILWLLLGHVVTSSEATFPPQLREAEHVLLVVAHPDDESLFFSPTILHLTRRRTRGATALLVMSAGNHYGKGAVRQMELKASCDVLGIWKDHCEALDLPALPDDPKLSWPREKIQAIVKDYVAHWKIDAIITFDSGGVSGHINHRAVSDAIVNYASTTPLAPPTYTLTTTNILRKYSLLGDLPLTVLRFGFGIVDSLLSIVIPGYSPSTSGRSALFVNSLSLWRQGVVAFQQHSSQNSWDRHLYVVLSRYMWFNDLRLVASSQTK